MSSIKKTFIFLSILFVMGTAWGCSTGTDKIPDENTPKIEKKERWTEVDNDIFVFTSNFYMVNMVVIKDNNDGILIDTGADNNDKDRLQQFIQENKISLKKIIITHLHSDHSANLGAFKVPRADVITPINAKEGQIIKLGDRTLKIIFTEGHFMKKGHISVELTDENILISGDVICNNIIPPIAAGGSFNDLLNTLKELEERNYSVIIPGHGEIVSNDLIFERQYEYLNNAKKHIEGIIASGGSVEDLDKIKLEDCIHDTSYLYKEQLDYWHQQSLKVIYNQLKHQ